MKDARGVPLELGDKILYTYWRCSGLYEGEIIRITPKTIIIKNKFVRSYSIRKSNLAQRIIKI